MPESIRFTKHTLEHLPLPEPGQRMYYQDAKIAGLLICITETGARSFRVRRKVNGKSIRVTLGRYPDMTIEQARKHAQAALSRLADGANPIAEKRADKARNVTLAEVFADYLKSRNLKPRTVADYQGVMAQALADWQAKPITRISRDMVLRRHTRLSQTSKARANYAMRLLRALFNFAADEYEQADGTPLIGFNPVRKLSSAKAWHQIERRQTVIKPHQLPAWFEAVLSLEGERAGAKADVTRDYLQFLLFTGLRSGEAARLRWSDVDFQGRSFIIRDTKNRRPHELPMTDYLQALLIRRQTATGKNPYVFPGRSKVGHIADPRYWMAHISQQSGVEFCLHDLRRTFIAIAESLDIPPYALKRLLNHKSGNSDVTNNYIVIDTKRLRAPMQKITDYILKAADLKRSAAVVNLHSGGQHVQPSA